jgi:hypothetical protein
VAAARASRARRRRPRTSSPPYIRTRTRRRRPSTSVPPRATRSSSPAR